jgi:hypothetical protein
MKYEVDIKKAPCISSPRLTPVVVPYPSALVGPRLSLVIIYLRLPSLPLALVMTSVPVVMSVRHNSCTFNCAAAGADGGAWWFVIVVVTIPVYVN